MSFTKAKIHRFNEDVSCAPPPGTYNPELKQSVKLSLISKGKRFEEPKLDPQEAHSSRESLDGMENKKTLQEKFKKPIVAPRFLPQKNQIDHSRRAKLRRSGSLDEINVKYTGEMESLRETLLLFQRELESKTAKQIQLNSEIERLLEECMRRGQLVDQSNERIQLRDEIIDSLIEKFAYFEDFSDSCVNYYNDHISTVMDILKFVSKCDESADTSVRETCNKFEWIISQYQKQLEDVSIFFDEMNIKEKQTLEDAEEIHLRCSRLDVALSEAHNVIETLKTYARESNCEIDKLNEQITAMRDSQPSAENIKEMIYNSPEYVTLLRVVDERMQCVKTEIEEKDLLISSQNEVIGESRLRLQEAEDLASTLQCKLETAEIREERNQGQRRELADRVKSAIGLVHQVENKVHVVLDEREQLHREMANLEKQVSDWQERYIMKCDEFETLKLDAEKMAVEKSSTDSKYEKLIFDMIEYQSAASYNVELAKNLDKELNEKMVVCDKLSQANALLSKQYSDLQKDHVDKCREFEDMANLLRGKENKILELEERLLKWELDLKERNDCEADSTFIEDGNDRDLNVCELCSQLEKSLKSEVQSRQDLEERYAQLCELIRPFKSQLDEYEEEKKYLLSKQSEAEGTISDLSQKYADILGHCNRKQKIRHIVKLKEDIIQLRKEKEDLQKEVARLKKKLKLESKENVCPSKMKYIPRPSSQPCKELNTTFTLTSPK